jgi:hypothetical protein
MFMQVMFILLDIPEVNAKRLIINDLGLCELVRFLIVFIDDVFSISNYLSSKPNSQDI